MSIFLKFLQIGKHNGWACSYNYYIWFIICSCSEKITKKMISYIIIAEVGYMIGGFFLGNSSGMYGSILHIINDSVMTLGLFMAAGIFYMEKLESDKISNLKGLFTNMPFTMNRFLL